ncbi:MAG: hypothetical protein ABW252_05955 [Polyangiales bacterium]
MALACAGPARAEAPAFKCAVDTNPRQLSAPALCEAVGKALARPVERVDDARRARGEALQVVHSDVQWIVIWRVDGKVRAWTRVSKLEAEAPQLKLLVSAAEALVRRAPKVGARCVRLDPNAGHKMRAPELAYPWAALKPCKPLMVEVVDPWWLADEAATP